MSHQAGNDPEKKHRHDIGEPDHGTVSDAATTRTIQIILSIWIVASLALTLYSFFLPLSGQPGH
ncbi:hypothetical protein [Haliangium ochraceum]|uniref:Uncharacterized protein n=1 Tax=Haliangium ochraceum (strain DSM 14365 / JCM 11303 / SMP-2) TaxID=502025 RepID=D0LP34_HALO1|nr:hypothetical protein [Haliangium ochraceum]ACY18860.1 hypothetical protein Hoch_6391 [Haliangium ochraceum DSM 14365]